MKRTLARRLFCMVKHMMGSVLVMSVALLLFACGEEQIDIDPETKATYQAMFDKSQPQTVQCSDVATIAAGWYHTVGLKKDRMVVAVGSNGNGQLDVSSWQNIKAITSGWYHTIGLNNDGTVVAVGSNGNGQLDVSSWQNIKAIAGGAYHTVGLREDGTVVAVGYNGYGVLNVSSWSNVKAIAAGAYHTVGLKEDGTVMAVGYNGYSQLNVSSWSNVKVIAAGAYHTVGLHEDGTVVAVGNNAYGQLNVSSFTNIMPVCEANEANKDVIPPVTQAVMTGKMGNNGWYVSDVQMTLTATDIGGSGVKEIHYRVDTKEAIAQGNWASHSIAGEGIHGVIRFAIDNATNVEMPQWERIRIDKSVPKITALVSPSPNADGWNNTDVTITFTCTDSVSGIASCPAPIAVTTEGAGQVVIDSAVDKAGNSAAAKVILNIDKTPPSVPSVSAGPSVLWPPNHKMVNVLIGGSVTDGGSGIASTKITVTDEYGIYNMTVPGFGSTIRLESWRAGKDKDGRLYTVTAVTTDKAGNRSTAATSILVPHDIGDNSCKEREGDERDGGEDHDHRGHADRRHGGRT